MSRFNRSRIIAVACAFLAVPAGAQTFRGTVVDSDSGEPVVLAYVGLLAEGQEMVVAALANTAGEFEVTAPSAGGYFLYVSRTGYETLMDGVFDLGEGGEFSLQVLLKPSPIELEEVVVESSTRSMNPLERNGFYDRAVTGLGTLMIREEIQRRAIHRVSDVFRMIPGLEIDESRPLTGSPDVLRNPTIHNWRNGRKCSPALYIDRHVVNAGGSRPLRPDDYMTASEVEAIEVYTRTSEVPVGFDEVTSCGVILVWTRAR